LIFLKIKTAVLGFGGYLSVCLSAIIPIDIEVVNLDKIKEGELYEMYS